MTIVNNIGKELDDVSLGWMVGMLEGEGSFVYKKNCSPAISFCTTDPDIAVRMHTALPSSTLNGPYSGRDGTKDTYYVRVWKRNSIRYIVERIMPHLGYRRAIAAQRLYDACD